MYTRRSLLNDVKLPGLIGYGDNPAPCLASVVQATVAIKVALLGSTPERTPMELNSTAANMARGSELLRQLQPCARGRAKDESSRHCLMLAYCNRYKYLNPPMLEYLGEAAWYGSPFYCSCCYWAPQGWRPSSEAMRYLEDFTRCPQPGADASLRNERDIYDVWSSSSLRCCWPVGNH